MAAVQDEEELMFLYVLWCISQVLFITPGTYLSTC